MRELPPISWPIYLPTRRFYRQGPLRFRSDDTGAGAEPITTPLRRRGVTLIIINGPKLTKSITPRLASYLKMGLGRSRGRKRVELEESLYRICELTRLGTISITLVNTLLESLPPMRAAAFSAPAGAPFKV